jgi:hypothetical protein
VIFKSVVEFPLVLFLLALALAFLCSRSQKASANKFDFIFPGALGVAVALLCLWLRSGMFRMSPIMSFVVFAGPLVICFGFSK